MPWCQRYFESIEFVQRSFAEIEPEIVVMIGEYGGRATVTVERIAQNLNDSTRYGLEDNNGYALQGQMTVPEAYYSTLPIRAMVKAMPASGIPSDISDTPGIFRCNHLMYDVLHHIHTNDPPFRAGWIHLPRRPPLAALPENLGAPSMSVETCSLGVEIGLRAILDNSQGIDEPVLSRLQT